MTRTTFASFEVSSSFSTLSSTPRLFSLFSKFLFSSSFLSDDEEEDKDKEESTFRWSSCCPFVEIIIFLSRKRFLTSRWCRWKFTIEFVPSLIVAALPLVLLFSASCAASAASTKTTLGNETKEIIIVFVVAPSSSSSPAKKARLVRSLLSSKTKKKSDDENTTTKSSASYNSEKNRRLLSPCLLLRLLRLKRGLFVVRIVASTNNTHPSFLKTRALSSRGVVRKNASAHSALTMRGLVEKRNARARVQKKKKEISTA